MYTSTSLLTIDFFGYVLQPSLPRVLKVRLIASSAQAQALKHCTMRHAMLLQLVDLAIENRRDHDPPTDKSDPVHERPRCAPKLCRHFSYHN